MERGGPRGFGGMDLASDSPHCPLHTRIRSTDWLDSQSHRALVDTAAVLELGIRQPRLLRRPPSTPPNTPPNILPTGGCLPNKERRRWQALPAPAMAPDSGGPSSSDLKLLYPNLRY